MRDSLGVMGLEEGVTVWKVKVRYRFFARQPDCDKHGIVVTGMTAAEAVERMYPPLDFKKTPLVQSLVERTAFSDQN